MREARGRSVLFTDADLSAPIEEAPKLLEALETYDVAIGSRALDRSLISVHESRFREFAGIIFNAIVRSDPATAPLWTRNAASKRSAANPAKFFFEQQRIVSGSGFDPELLYLARHHGLRTIEIPVRWGHSPATKVNMF